MMFRVVGLTGYAGSGKSAAARYMVERHGFVQVKFAGPLKQMMRAIGLGDEEIEGCLKERPCALLGGKTPRFAMQTLGTEWGRALFGEAFWVNLAYAKVADVLDHGGRVVIDDCRFQNEAEALRGVGGAIVRISRPGVGPVNSHCSEAGIEADHEIVNDRRLLELYAEIDRLLGQ